MEDAASVMLWNNNFYDDCTLRTDKDVQNVKSSDDELGCKEMLVAMNNRRSLIETKAFEIMLKKEI